MIADGRWKDLVDDAVEEADKLGREQEVAAD